MRGREFPKISIWYQYFPRSRLQKKIQDSATSTPAGSMSEGDDCLGTGERLADTYEVEPVVTSVTDDHYV